MGDRRGQQQGARTGNHPEKEDDFPVVWEGKIPDGKGAKQHCWDPNRGEFLDAVVQSWGDFSEGVDGIDEAGQSGVFANGDHLANHRTFGQDKSGFDKVADPDINGHRFSRERRFVEGTFPFNDTSIGRDELTASNFDGIARPNQVDGNHFPLGRCRLWRGEVRPVAGHGKYDADGGRDSDGVVLVDLSCGSW